MLCEELSQRGRDRLAGDASEINFVTLDLGAESLHSCCSPELMHQSQIPLKSGRIAKRVIEHAVEIVTLSKAMFYLSFLRV